jgi:choline dehydrogenase
LNSNRSLIWIQTVIDLFSRYFRKFEKYVPNPEYPDIDVSKKGAKGPVQVGYFSSITQPSLDFINACVEIGIPFSPDFNTSSGTRGVSRVCAGS